jgi:metal-sulfur cluster biosynthetic enzyme
MVNTDYEVKILMTLTSPNCPVAESLPREVEDKVKSIKSVKAEVEITLIRLEQRFDERRRSKTRIRNALIL